MAREHELHSSPQTVHWGVFDATIEPVLEIDSGDRVTIHAINGPPDSMPKGGGFEILPEHLAVHREVKPAQFGHILTGPVAVAGAEPGDMLEVRIVEVRLRQNWGHNVIRPLLGALPDDFPDLRILHIPIDRERAVATLPWGTELPLRPFFGVMGVAPPPAWSAISTIIPRRHGGNLDNKELVAGTTLYLPIFTRGAGFSAGDGHAVQGDGEVCVTALETALSGTFELIVHKGVELTMPRAETPTHYITMGLDGDLDDAAKQALREMIAFICERTNLSAEDAYSLCSLAADLRVTQIVNVDKGVHMMLPKTLLHG